MSVWDCGGPLAEHTRDGCGCENCTFSPQQWCGLAAFQPPQRIAYLAEQLAPLLSAHLNAAAQRRCVAVAHLAHHALIAYDYPEGTRDA